MITAMIYFTSEFRLSLIKFEAQTFRGVIFAIYKMMINKIVLKDSNIE